MALAVCPCGHEFDMPKERSNTQVSLICDKCKHRILVMNTGDGLRVMRGFNTVHTKFDAPKKSCAVSDCPCDDLTLHDMAPEGTCARCGHNIAVHFGPNEGTSLVPSLEERAVTCGACFHQWLSNEPDDEPSCPQCEIKQLRQDLGAAHIAMTEPTNQAVPPRLRCDCGNLRRPMAAVCDECEELNTRLAEREHRRDERHRRVFEPGDALHTKVERRMIGLVRDRNTAGVTIPSGGLCRCGAPAGPGGHNFLCAKCLRDDRRTLEILAPAAGNPVFTKIIDSLAVCTTPGCGDSGVCDECRKRGAK